MNSQPLPNDRVDFLGTFAVAKVLGVSVGTVQALVERGDLQCWKTQGGHRRISRESVQNYQRRFEKHPGNQPQTSTLRVLIVDDDPVFLTAIKETTDKWDLNVKCVLLSSAIEALMCISELQPHVLFSDLRMPGVDGFEFLRKLRSTPQYDAMHLVAMTSMSQAEIAERGGLPSKVTLLKKPLDMRWLHGFVSALVSEIDLQTSSQSLSAQQTTAYYENRVIL